MTSSPATRQARGGILSQPYTATTIGIFALIAFSAFETMAVTTIMPTVSRELDGFALYAPAMAAPFASGVVGMVAAGAWSDRRGPAGSLLAALVLFTIGVLVGGLTPTMDVMVVGRIIQGLGAGALMVSLYVVVGLVFPARLQPSIFATFAAAWVLPSLFGPPVAALVADVLGWRWVFLGIVVLVVLAALLIAPVVPGLRRPDREASRTPRSRLLWAVLAAAAVFGVELANSFGGLAFAAVAAVTVLVALRPLTPRGTLRSVRGLPSVIGTRAMMSAAFFVGQAYIVLVLQDRWGYTPGRAGIALMVVGVVWAGMSQVQARLGERITSETAMRVGSGVVLVAVVGTWLVVWTDASGLLAGATFVLAGAGMGFGFSRTGVAMLSHSTEADRGFNSSAISIADSMGAALALSLCGIGFGLVDAAGGDPFLAVFAISVAFAVTAVVTASRTPLRAARPA